MAFGAEWFTWVPNPVWIVVHAVTVLAALYFLSSAVKKNCKELAWAFGLYAVGAVLYTLVHLGAVDNYTTHILESVLVFVAVILVYLHSRE